MQPNRGPSWIIRRASGGGLCAGSGKYVPLHDKMTDADELVGRITLRGNVSSSPQNGVLPPDD